ncbi:MAG: HAD family hydrolase [Quadrisphaera sp.]
MAGPGRVVFWDFDGTLARRHDMWSGALVDVLRSFDPRTKVTAEQVRPWLQDGFPWHSPDTVREGQSAEQWWSALRPLLVSAFTGVGLGPAEAARAASRVPDQYYRPDAWTVVEGAEQALQTIAAAGFRNVVLSNHGPELPTLVDALGLGRHVETTITSAAVGAEKPNPAIFVHARRATGLEAGDEAWMVGDNPVADVQGALTSGLRAVLVADAPEGVGAVEAVTVLQAARLVVAGGSPPVRQEATGTAAQGG